MSDHDGRGATQPAGRGSPGRRRLLLHDVALHQDATPKNATVESCVRHARVLTEFLYPDDPWDDDVTLDDYVVDRTSWTAARGGMPAILHTVVSRTGKEFAHPWASCRRR